MEINQSFEHVLKTSTPGSLCLKVEQPKDQSKDPNGSVTGIIAVTVPAPDMRPGQYDCKKILVAMGPVFRATGGGKMFPEKDSYKVSGIIAFEEWTQAEKLAFYQSQLAALQTVAVGSARKS
ncbi:MAG: hypothetical protein WA817_12120 [Candidatus Acidiferrum sp.]